MWYNYGNYLRDQEVKETAATCYKEAVRLWPDYVIALNNLATVTDNQTDIETLLLKALHPLPAAALLAISDALIAQLAARTADGGTERVGEVFEAAAPKVLEAMCSWYDWHERAASELRRLTEASAGARAFVRRAAADERCGDGRAARREDRSDALQQRVTRGGRPERVGVHGGLPQQDVGRPLGPARVVAAVEAPVERRVARQHL